MRCGSLPPTATPPAPVSLRPTSPLPGEIGLDALVRGGVYGQEAHGVHHGHEAFIIKLKSVLILSCSSLFCSVLLDNRMVLT